MSDSNQPDWMNEMRVTFDAEELSSFFAGFAPLESSELDVEALGDILPGQNED